ncbi:MAG: hypothetical protein GKR90_06655 [Pseudomonadales bacterium]|nr:hypothetical protein [Pseudomonadales bacterium]
MKTNNYELNRRQLLQGILSGVGASLSLAACANVQLFPDSSEFTPSFYTESEFKALSRLADLILPRTETPGAIDAGVPGFMDQLMTDWASSETQEKHRHGLHDVMQQLADNTSFTEASDQTALLRLEKFDHDSFAAGEIASSPESVAYKEIKSIIVRAYFTSELGATQELEWIPVPGRWDPAVPITSLAMSHRSSESQNAV